MQKGEGVWLNKFISESGLCSRREADKFIEGGHVFVNRKRANIGDKVFEGDRVRVNGNELEPLSKDNIIFIALNKPKGIVSTSERNVKDNIVKFVNYGVRIYPIGRLDKDSQGLIFLTNDGDMVNKILRAGNNHEKEYVVTVNKSLTDAAINGMANGVPMMGIMTKKCKIVKEGPRTFRITLIQGINRQIRRMCEHYNYEVIKLERVRIMNISLKGIPLGEWRELNDEEMREIYRLTKDSSSAPVNVKNEPLQEKKKSSNKKSLVDETGKFINRKSKEFRKKLKTAATTPEKKESKTSGYKSKNTSEKKVGSAIKSKQANPTKNTSSFSKNSNNYGKQKR